MLVTSLVAIMYYVYRIFQGTSQLPQCQGSYQHPEHGLLVRVVDGATVDKFCKAVVLGLSSIVAENLPKILTTGVLQVCDKVQHGLPWLGTSSIELNEFIQMLQSVLLRLSTIHDSVESYERIARTCQNMVKGGSQSTSLSQNCALRTLPILPTYDSSSVLLQRIYNAIKRDLFPRCVNPEHLEERYIKELAKKLLEIIFATVKDVPQLRALVTIRDIYTTEVCCGDYTVFVCGEDGSKCVSAATLNSLQHMLLRQNDAARGIIVAFCPTKFFVAPVDTGTLPSKECFPQNATTAVVV